MAKDMNEQTGQQLRAGAKVRFAWVVIRTKQGMEVRCKEAMEKQGFLVYLPVFQKVDAKFRRTYPAPFLPNYLFVQLSAATPKWWAIYSTIGVHSVMGGEKPILLRDAALEVLRRHEENGFVQLVAGGRKEAVPDWEKGQRLKIKGGPFDHLEVILAEPVDERRSWLLASLIGGSDSQARKVRVEWRDLIPLS